MESCQTCTILGFPDCELEDTCESRVAVTAAIHRHRPDLVITQSPHRTRNLGLSNRDHRMTGSLALDCIYPLARHHLCFPELLAQGLAIVSVGVEEGSLCGLLGLLSES